ncbi:MAG: hemolysin III family protein, partial [Acutalibacteraceae bacterium]|nr:hemolysin III family protein [Acutalibacteraceae bacterium]
TQRCTMQSKSLKRPQTLGEEISNAVSHGIGGLLSIAGTVILIILGAKAESVAAVIWGAFYGATLIILYTVSCLYHSLARNRAKKVFRVLDHCSIFLLISGTYAPISVLMIGGKIGFSLITVNIACAVLGILLNAINMEKWKKLSLLLYVIMGWMCLFAIKPIIAAAPKDILWLLIAGGVAYTVGIIFYKMSKKKYMHFIWHLFVLIGSILHYFFVLFGCYM